MACWMVAIRLKKSFEFRLIDMAYPVFGMRFFGGFSFMVDALPGDRDRIINILARAFDENISVNHLVLQDDKRAVRIRRLMEYAIAECEESGRVLMSADRTACALVMFPDKKRFSLRSLLRDLRLVFKVMGISNLSKVMKKERMVRTVQSAVTSDGLAYYIWFMGVHPNYQGRGAGSRLLGEMVSEAALLGRLCILETSNEKNIPFYERAGFIRYQLVNVGYPLHFFKLDNDLHKNLTLI
ncbi:Acetyltransferase (GNAT) family protein [compost metagenome]